MAYNYTEALSIFKANGVDEDELKVAYNSFIDQIQKGALYKQLENTNISGDPQSGSVNVRRLQTSTVRDYGTARTAQAGDAVSNNGVIVNLDQRKEVVEEVEKFDVLQYGLPDIISRRSGNMALSVDRALDNAFFAEAEAEGTEVTIVGTTIADQMEEVILSLENTQNNNVDGVDREMIDLCLKPQVYADLLTYVDTLPNPQNGGVMADYFHKVRVHSNMRQSKDVIAMTSGMAGAIALPTAVKDMKFGEETYSIAQVLGFYYNYGVKAVASDLIYWADLTAISA